MICCLSKLMQLFPLENMNSKKIAYISSPSYHELCDKHIKIQGRASLVHSLICAYNLNAEFQIVAPTVANEKDLVAFHSNDYIDFIKQIQDAFIKCERTCEEPFIKGEYCSEHFEDLSEDMDIFGLGYDCDIFPHIYNYISYVAGATLTAVNILLNKKADIAINFNGGWHHAHVNEAAGFCYVNDIAIGILHALKKHKRVLYIDLDVHHGDAVEEAFAFSKKVFTFSLHKYGKGFFPGSGSLESSGKGGAKNYSVNVPLHDGVDDNMYCHIFKSLFSKIADNFQPELIVCQCGADALAGDPLGAFNLTSESFKFCINEISKKGKPLLILGGGGYNFVNTAKCWTEIISSLLGKKLNSDIPEHDYLEHYGPDYLLDIRKSNKKNENTEEYFTKILTVLLSNIDCIQVTDLSLNDENNGKKVIREQSNENKENANFEQKQYLSINEQPARYELSKTVLTVKNSV